MQRINSLDGRAVLLGRPMRTPEGQDENVPFTAWAAWVLHPSVAAPPPGDDPAVPLYGNVDSAWLHLGMRALPAADTAPWTAFSMLADRPFAI